MNGDAPDHIEEVATNVIGAALEVHRRLGPGFQEKVYQNAMAVELDHRGLPFVEEHPVTVPYRGQTVGRSRVDLFVSDVLVVELKAISAIAPVHTAQVISYLKATRQPLGLLFNFKRNKLKGGGIRRVIRTNPDD